MHELAIAQSVLQVVRRHASGRRVWRVELRVGHLRQVVPSALRLAFDLVAQGTEAHAAELVIDDVAVAGRCRDCGLEGLLPEFPFRCAGCGGLDIVVTAGEELLVDSIEIEDRSQHELVTDQAQQA